MGAGTSAEEFFLKSVNVESIFECIERKDYLFLYSIKEWVDHEGDRFVSGALQRVRVNGLQSVHKKYSFPVCQCGILIL